MVWCEERVFIARDFLGDEARNPSWLGIRRVFVSLALSLLLVAFVVESAPLFLGDRPLCSPSDPFIPPEAAEGDILFGTERAAAVLPVVLGSEKANVKRRLLFFYSRERGRGTTTRFFLLWSCGKKMMRQNRRSSNLARTCWRFNPSRPSSSFDLNRKRTDVLEEWSSQTNSITPD